MKFCEMFGKYTEKIRNNNYRAAHPKQEITYEQPAPSKDHPNVSYEQPDAQPHEGPIYAQTTQPEETPTTDNSDTTPQA